MRSLKESSEERRKLRDTINTETIDRILSAFEGKKGEELHWHKRCYAKYTDKGKISRLRRFLDSTNAKPSQSEISASSALRSKTSSTDWELCMLCQDGETSKKRSICSVTTLKMSQQILEGAKRDHDLSCVWQV